ncbi:DUF1653 domain-containing protein, partial [Candidatus Peregrinibacteria bacterium]|nr:DUF1653 domain-containing protein [Candidatus Peregrinibacteria bacterium]
FVRPYDSFVQTAEVDGKKIPRFERVEE